MKPRAHGEQLDDPLLDEVPAGQLMQLAKGPVENVPLPQGSHVAVIGTETEDFNWPSTTSSWPDLHGGANGVTIKNKMKTALAAPMRKDLEGMEGTFAGGASWRIRSATGWPAPARMRRSRKRTT